MITFVSTEFYLAKHTIPNRKFVIYKIFLSRVFYFMFLSLHVIQINTK